jgi:hypothetical protein
MEFSTGGWRGVKEMLCGAQVWTEEEVMCSTGGKCGVKERLCVAQ